MGAVVAFMAEFEHAASVDVVDVLTIVESG